MLKNSKIFFGLILRLIIFVNEVMEKKQIKAKYIVVRQPDNNIAYRNSIRFLYIVITREELSKKSTIILTVRLKGLLVFMLLLICLIILLSIGKFIPTKKLNFVHVI
jgi:hypothetical protein